MIHVAIADIEAKAANRPAGYLDDMLACAAARTETHLSYDTRSDGWRALMAKYRQRVTPQRSTAARPSPPSPCCSAPSAPPTPFAGE